ncbi:UDP-2,4-diacetamido-2,4,6-trideoxy-beta-L-altropyranose hydrolase [Thiopseudomonas acetoxidans]|uniref:UDP-2,4-diacetamido-2,4, 6-trideoxy-beta-L-altropyranose hydrolase n=1 Tax=Thiopseudomonas acetoxidans TaxID=3041622 RepID=A0ABT7STQ7_9GAMM|nr:UDP-2,4-diacetamido-2,4,6-trideoxy-beta-L-altropyranose hydrolase [Thiopseudomonas sp. CY1220]MDM7858932.1 UDP-2,4-diacetamido-2,4,6-trideoxy-beta-L-altropyranose hydrolase [Thiopseudomonas sp. CY1220]
MKIVLRVDASIEMGSGHVMRCLTLADALTQAGAECHFICREHPGHLNALITERGHIVNSLPYIEQHKQRQYSKAEELAHANWLRATQEQDLESCIPILKLLQPDWLIVDHYAIDERWHKKLRPYCQKIMVIDDLADRQHDCDLLLDQTFGRSEEDYVLLVPEHCEILCGAQYALLRPEFAQWRDYSLKRRAQGQLEHLLINLGGVDKDNITTEILQALANTALPDNCRITVVMGATAPWVERVQQQAALMPWPTEVKVGVNNMAELMANSDLAIGAAGATSWERCCLGLPSIVICLADNQRKVIRSLEQSGAAILCSLEESISSIKLSPKLKLAEHFLVRLIKNSSIIIDGLGCNRVVNKIWSENE